MSFNSAMLEAMQAEGLDLDACIRILRAAEKKADPTNAVRQARHRAKKAGNNGVTVTGVTIPPNDRDILTPGSTPVISEEITPPIELTEDQVLQAYNVMASQAGLSKAKMTPERKKKLKPFIRRHPIDDITEAIWAIPKSRFLCGENDRGWKADFDFLLQPKSFTRLIEGTYAS